MKKIINFLKRLLKLVDNCSIINVKDCRKEVSEMFTYHYKHKSKISKKHDAKEEEICLPHKNRVVSSKVMRKGLDYRKMNILNEAMNSISSKVSFTEVLEGNRNGDY
jgi:hypothetical protein